MSSIVDVYLHGSVHLTNPGSEELFIGILAREPHTAVAAPEGPGGFPLCVPVVELFSQPVRLLGSGQ